MNLLSALLLVSFVFAIEGSPQPQFGFIKDAYRGAKDMHRAYSDMREANWKNSDKYFHARGNQDAAKHGEGGKFAASAISNAREMVDRIRGGTKAQSEADQAANRFGRNGGNLDVLRPKGLPSKY